MPDNGVDIYVEEIFAERMSGEETNKNLRFVIGSISGEFEADQNLSLTLYFKRTNAVAWESVGPFTINKDLKRFRQRLYPVISCINYYIKVSGNFTETYDVTSIKAWEKILPTGKFG